MPEEKTIPITKEVADAIFVSSYHYVCEKKGEDPLECISSDELRASVIQAAIVIASHRLVEHGAVYTRHFLEKFETIIGAELDRIDED